MLFAKREAPRQRPIFPEGCPSSIVGAEAFHFRVRDGNGWVHLALVTEALSNDTVANTGATGKGPSYFSTGSPALTQPSVPPSRL